MILLSSGGSWPEESARSIRAKPKSMSLTNGAEVVTMMFAGLISLQRPVFV